MEVCRAQPSLLCGSTSETTLRVLKIPLGMRLRVSTLIFRKIFRRGIGWPLFRFTLNDPDGEVLSLSEVSGLEAQHGTLDLNASAAAGQQILYASER